jgi:hypothetical protein
MATGLLGTQANQPISNGEVNPGFNTTVTNPIGNTQVPVSIPDTPSYVQQVAPPPAPEMRDIKATETVAGQLNTLLSSESPYVKLARSKALETANQRGLLNTSIAAGAGEKAAIESALPIAQQDAQTYAASGLSAQNAGQDLTKTGYDANLKSGLNKEASVYETLTNTQNIAANSSLQQQKDTSALTAQTQAEQSAAELQALRDANALKAQTQQEQYNSDLSAQQAQEKLTAQTQAEQSTSALQAQRDAAAVQLEKTKAEQQVFLQKELAAAGLNYDLMKLQVAEREAMANAIYPITQQALSAISEIKRTPDSVLSTTAKETAVAEIEANKASSINMIASLYGYKLNWGTGSATPPVGTTPPGTANPNPATPPPGTTPATPPPGTTPATPPPGTTPATPPPALTPTTPAPTPTNWTDAAATTQKMAAGLLAPNMAYDFNKDGKVDLNDASMAAAYNAGTIPVPAGLLGTLTSQPYTPPPTTTANPTYNENGGLGAPPTPPPGTFAGTLPPAGQRAPLSAAQGTTIDSEGNIYNSAGTKVGKQYITGTYISSGLRINDNYTLDRDGHINQPDGYRAAYTDGIKYYARNGTELAIDPTTTNMTIAEILAKQEGMTKTVQRRTSPWGTQTSPVTLTWYNAANSWTLPDGTKVDADGNIPPPPEPTPEMNG